MDCVLLLIRCNLVLSSNSAVEPRASSPGALGHTQPSDPPILSAPSVARKTAVLRLLAAHAGTTSPKEEQVNERVAAVLQFLRDVWRDGSRRPRWAPALPARRLVERFPLDRPYLRVAVERQRGGRDRVAGSACWWRREAYRARGGGARARRSDDEQHSHAAAPSFGGVVGFGDRSDGAWCARHVGTSKSFAVGLARRRPAVPEDLRRVCRRTRCRPNATAGSSRLTISPHRRGARGCLPPTRRVARSGADWAPGRRADNWRCMDRDDLHLGETPFARPELVMRRSWVRFPLWALCKPWSDRCRPLSELGQPPTHCYKLRDNLTRIPKTFVRSPSTTSRSRADQSSTHERQSRLFRPDRGRGDRGADLHLAVGLQPRMALGASLRFAPENRDTRPWLGVLGLDDRE